jgi:hypothetical protein
LFAIEPQKDSAEDKAECCWERAEAVAMSRRGLIKSLEEHLRSELYKTSFLKHGRLRKPGDKCHKSNLKKGLRIEKVGPIEGADFRNIRDKSLQQVITPNRSYKARGNASEI